MAFSDLYFSCKFEPLSDKQKKSLEEACIDTELKDKSCSRESLNTCAQSAEELLSQYSIYDSQKGLYSSWGGVEFPWEISEETVNLLWEETDDKWKIAKYRAVVAYMQGDRVLLIEDDGYKLVLYEAIEDVLAISGAFDNSKWQEICRVETSIPAGVPSIEFLTSRYAFYELNEQYDTEWGKYTESWSEALKDASIASAPGGLTIAELDAWLKQKANDRWDEARVLKQFFYRKGDIVLVLGECEDAICLYVANQDIPVTEEIFNEYRTFKPGIWWNRMYCLNTGNNRCLEPRRTKTPKEAYELVELGSNGDYAEIPKPFYLKPKAPSLDEIVNRRNTTLPTQCEIDRLAGEVLPPEIVPIPLPSVTVTGDVTFSGIQDATIIFTFSRASNDNTSLLDVFYTISGNADPSEWTTSDIEDAPVGNGVKVRTIPSGQNTVQVVLLTTGWYAKTVTFTIITKETYNVGTPAEASIGVNYD